MPLSPATLETITYSESVRTNLVQAKAAVDAAIVKFQADGALRIRAEAVTLSAQLAGWIAYFQEASSVLLDAKDQNP